MYKCGGKIERYRSFYWGFNQETMRREGLVTTKTIEWNG